MSILLVTLNILAALFLIGVVLLQSGKGADMGAAFGGASSTVFGPSGAGNLLTKLTAASAAVFMLTSLGLAVISAQDDSVFDGLSEPTTQAPPPIVPAAQPEAAPVEQAANEAAQAAGGAAGATDGASEQAAPASDAAPAVDESAGAQ